MADKDNTLKTADPKGEHSADEKVIKPVEMRKVLTEKEAQELVDKENGTYKEPTTEEEEPGTEEPKAELPERYKGKTAEELVKLLDEKEKYIQSRSDEIGDFKKKVKEAEVLSEKVAKIEAENMKQTQAPGNLPQRPVEPVISDSEYYDDPTKALRKVLDYNKKLLDYTDQVTSAKTAPFYQGDMERKREKLYKDLEDKYKDSPVNFDRKKVQEFLSQNPEYFKQYKTKAYEQAYHDISAPDLSKSREKMREELKAEVMEEIKTNKQAGNIGLNDLATPQAGKATEYDKDKMEDDPEYRKQVIADMEKRKRTGKI